MLGTWEIAKMKKSSLPEKVASGFSEATKNLKGAKYRPVLYCGKQIRHEPHDHLQANAFGQRGHRACGGDDAAPTFAEAGKEMGDRLHHAHRVRARTR